MIKLNAAQLERFDQLYAELEALAPAARLARLEAIATDDPDLAAILRSALGEPASLRSLAPGDAVGNCTLIERLSAGGCGEVWKASQELSGGLTRTVALKLIRPDHLLGANASEYLARFNQEIAMVKDLRGEGIAQLHDAGTTMLPGGDQEVPYFVMEYVPGKPVTEALRGRDAPAQVACFQKVCAAMQRAHNHGPGVLHLDLKPHNVLVIEDGGELTPKVLDFGLARCFDPVRRLDAEHFGSGTLPYMAPEQLDPKLGGPDFRTDVHALGVMLFEALTGQLPHDVPEGAPSGYYRAIGQGPRRQLREVMKLPPIDLKDAQWQSLEVIVGRAMAVQREERYRNPGELAKALADWLELLSPPPQPATQPDPNALREYLNAVIKECAPLKVKDILRSAATPGTQPLGLTSVYVDLNLDLQIPVKLTLAQHLATPKAETAELKHGRGADQLMERERETRLVPALEALAHHRQLVLLGAPGSGKSTLVAYVTLSLAEAAAGEVASLKRLGPLWSCGALLPVRVVLRRFAASLPKAPVEGRAKYLWDYLEADWKESGLSPGAAAVPRQVAAQSGALFLLDGLDEVREEATRARMLEAVAEFARTAGSNCRFLLTARPYAWDEFKDAASAPVGSTPAQLAEMHTAYRLGEFEPAQVQTFITRWYQAIQAAGWPVSDPKQRTQELQQAAQRADLAPLARNPLLLTLMATLHGNRAKLPEDRADLYNEVVELLLEWWNAASGATRGLLDALNIPSLKLSDLREVIQELAFSAHAAHAGKAGVADLPEAALVAALLPLLGNSADKAELALEYIENRAGLLLGQGKRKLQRQYTFPHRTFQEYLAACYLAGHPEFYDQTTYLAHENPPHWREVLTLAARHARAGRGVPAADALVHRVSVQEWCCDHLPDERCWRAAVIAGEQLLEIGLATVRSRELHRVVHDRVAHWLAALLEKSDLPAKERAQAGIVLGKLGDPRPGVGVKHGLPDLDWIEIPPGPFIMGSHKGETQWEDETPQFTCKLITHPYRISRYPVTVAQYQTFVDAGGYADKARNCWTADGWKWKEDKKITGPEGYDSAFQTPNHPRVGVSWYEAVAFCRWVTEQFRSSFGIGTSELIRLPSEIEWERVARHTDGRAYPWHDPTEKEKVAADLAQRCNMSNTGIGHTSAVGVFPSGLAQCGAADMAGNVWEWCRTKWCSDYREYEKKVDDAPDGIDARVLRGGSWGLVNPESLRCSFRSSPPPDSRYHYYGFRCVVMVGGSAPG